MKPLRPRQPADEQDDDNPLSGATWLYSYADLMTQLLLFAVLMLTVIGLKPPAEQPSPEQPADALASTGNELERALEDSALSGTVSIDRSADRLVIRMTSVLFEPGRDSLTLPARAVLDEVARLLVEIPNLVRVEGHTDDQPIRSGRFPSNWELSTGRAISVVQYLQDKGVGKQRLSVAGYGEFHGIAANDSADNRALNRRVEIVVLGE